MFYSKKNRHFKILSRELIRWLMVITIFSLGYTQAIPFNPTIKFLNFGMPEIFAVIYLNSNKDARPKGYFVNRVQME